MPTWLSLGKRPEPFPLRIGSKDSGTVERQLVPVEMRAGVGLAPGRDVGMRGQSLDRVACAQPRDQPAMPAKKRCAEGSSVLVNRRKTSSPPNRPGGRSFAVAEMAAASPLSVLFPHSAPNFGA